MIQDSSTLHMHGTIAEPIDWLARKVTQRLCAVITRGSPVGSGWPRGIRLEASPELTVGIERIGRLPRPIAAGD
jgi:hypothetical protein